MRTNQQLTVRVALSHDIPSIGSIEEVQGRIRRVAEHPLLIDILTDRWREALV